jgi:tripartite-type tricarboxylate transporter receptor subunit TctC
MHLARRKVLRLAAGAALLSLVSRAALALDYPTRPVHLLAGFPPGGIIDIIARLIGQWLSERLGQSFVIENRVGGGSNIATELVARAAPDGYTLLLANAVNSWNTTLYNHLNFDFSRDIAPVASISRGGSVMEVNPSFPAKTVPEFIAYAKANPGKINMAAAGPGSGPHLWGELFKVMADVDLVTVQYRGSGPALPELISGRADVMFDPVVSSIGYIRAGKLRPLGVTTATRSTYCPTCPLSAILCLVMKEAVGKVSVRLRKRRLRSSQSLTEKLMLLSPMPFSRLGSLIWVQSRLQARPPSSANSSPIIPRNGGS